MDTRRRTRRRLHNCDAWYTVTSRSCIYRYFSCLNLLLIHDCACVHTYVHNVLLLINLLYSCNI